MLIGLKNGSYRVDFFEIAVAVTTSPNFGRHTVLKNFIAR